MVDISQKTSLRSVQLMELSDIDSKNEFDDVIYVFKKRTKEHAFCSVHLFQKRLRKVSPFYSLRICV